MANSERRFANSEVTAKEKAIILTAVEAD